MTYNTHLKSIFCNLFLQKAQTEFALCVHQLNHNASAAITSWQSRSHHRWPHWYWPGTSSAMLESSQNDLTGTYCQAIALEYLRNGANVSISHLGGPKEDDLLEAMRKDVNEIEAGADKTRFITVAGDISQPETGQDFVAKTVEAFGRLDVFVSNAGVCQFAEFLE